MQKPLVDREPKFKNNLFTKIMVKSCIFDLELSFVNRKYHSTKGEPLENTSTVFEFHEFEPRLKSAKNRFQ